MNKKERRLLEKLYWYIAENKNEHHVVYYCKDVLYSILKGEYKIAENLLKKKTPLTPFPPKQSEEIIDRLNMLDNLVFEWLMHYDENRDWNILHDLFEMAVDKFYSPEASASDSSIPNVKEKEK